MGLRGGRVGKQQGRDRKSVVQDDLRLAALQPIGEGLVGSVGLFQVHAGTPVGKSLRWMNCSTLEAPFSAGFQYKLVQCEEEASGMTMGV